MSFVRICRGALAGAALLPMAATSLSAAMPGDGLQGIAPTDALVNPRALAGGATLLVTGLLLLLYFYRRRLYILYWVAGWILAAASLFVVARQYTTDRMLAVAYGVSQLLGILSALVFVISADAYRTRPRLRRGYGIVLLPVFLWFTLAPMALGAGSVYATGHLLIAGALVAAGAGHLALLRQSRLLGAVVVGVMMLALAGSNLWVALAAGGPGVSALSGPTFLNVALYLVMALGMQLMTFEDMTYELRLMNKQLESAQGELRQMVTTDPLTGCRNRRHFDEVIGREMERHRRYGIPLSLLFVDVDRFKAINDTLGHEAGDRVLQRVAAFLIRNVREADDVFRWGGDEFLILISCREEEAVRKAVELQVAFANSSEAATLPRGVGLSVGCAEVPADATDIMPIVKVADERMYVDKKR